MARSRHTDAEEARFGRASRSAALGVHVRGTAIGCDVARAGAICFLSRADVTLGRGRAARFIATERVASLRRKMGAALDEPLVPRFGRPFALGRVRLELLPSGRGDGAAQLLIELGNWRGLYAGAVWMHTNGPEPAQARACDELVIDAPDAGERDDLTVVDAAIFSGGVLRVDDLAVLAFLRERYGSRVRVGGAWRGLQARSEARHKDRRKAPVAAISVAPGPGGSSLTVIAGLRAPEAKRCLALGLGPTAADTDAWLAWVLGTGAKIVHVRAAHDHRLAAQLVATLRDHEVEARLLGPPQQLSLFPSPRITLPRDDA